MMQWYIILPVDVTEVLIWQDIKIMKYVLENPLSVSMIA